MRTILEEIYGRAKGADAEKRLAAIVKNCRCGPPRERQTLFSEADAILITYGDSLNREGEAPLKTLHRFADDYLKDAFSGIHILPFFPYSSDDGFSISDFDAVRPDLGGWQDVRRIAGDFDLMVDLVANHVSAKSRWFTNYLAERDGYRDLAIETDPKIDLTGVTRPRTLPLLTPFRKDSGAEVHLWTTFSADQIDLNYRSLDVLETMVKTLLHYVSQGARIIRLDAIAYLWKQIGTACVHLPETHAMVRLFRRILDEAAPGTLLITETNVPHAENVRYFGNGGDEAHMVYNFTLPPLLLYSLAKGNGAALSRWARTLTVPSAQNAFFNFTASHDGIGVRPLEGILPSFEIAWLARRVRDTGGLISSRRLPDGSESPYELNTTYLDALKDPEKPVDPLHVERFLASQAVALALPGVPAVYLHSLLGTHNWHEGVQLTGRARTINRRTLSVDAIGAEWSRGDNFKTRVFAAYHDMLRIRRTQPAFHPNAPARVLSLDDRVFAIERYHRGRFLVALTNLSPTPLEVSLAASRLREGGVDLLNAEPLKGDIVPLSPYASRWLAEV